jgi:anti-sigma B factor antagonist
MQIMVHEQSGVTVVCVSSELDAVNSRQLKPVLDRLVAEGRRRFVIDLNGVNFIDSAGLATLVHFFKRVRNSTGDVCLAALQPPVRRILELTRLDRVFDFHADVAAALHHFTGS